MTNVTKRVLCDPQNPYTDQQIDTRNIACVDISVDVIDVQDEPPMFINTSPITRIPPTLQPVRYFTTYNYRILNKHLNRYWYRMKL